MKNLLCLNSNTYHGFSLDEAIRGTAKAGFRYIELAAVRGYTEHVRWEMSGDEIRDVKAKLANHGLECIALGAHSNLNSAEGVSNFEQSIRLASRLGCKYIVTSTGDAHDDHDVIEDESELLRVLKPLAKMCESAGITLTIETHGNNYATGKAVKALVEQCDSRFIGVNYDTANVIFYGRTVPYEDLQQSSDRVEFIHLKDKIGFDQIWNFPAIGEGDIDFAKVFRILQTTNCTAPLSVEIEFTSAGPSGLEEVDQAVADSYRAIQTVMLQMNR